MMKMTNLAVVIFLLLITFGGIDAQVLNPNYFNIAEGRKINASSTCGENGPDLYCKLVGSNFGYEQTAHGGLIMGQSCDWCISSDPTKSHKAEYITDGTDRWWQSPPLSRDLSYAQVNLTLDLGQEFHIAYVLLKMGNSPRPDVWVLERSNDFNKTWSPWMYFAPTREDCIKFFGNASLEPITRDDSVICETKFSKIVPLENGEITVKLVSDRPGASNFSMSPTLQQWSKATNIRLRFLRPKTTLEDLVEGARRDKTVTRRYFYSLQDMNIGGRCVCNGHANVCNMLDPKEPLKLYCDCKHHTCGAQCDTCCPGFEQKKWKPATVNDHFRCEPCNCFGHSENCTYSEEIDLQKKSIDIHGEYSGGGQCYNCQDNTKGINCNECVDGYYRRPNTPLDSKEICAKCQCNESYHTGNCAPETGICECKANFNSPNCDSCAFGYVGYPTCRPCDCYINGTISEQCEFSPKPALEQENKDESEIRCPCKENYDGPECRKCAAKYFAFPNCTSCECEQTGSVDEVCDAVTGKCNCKNNFDGVKCERCRPGYFGYPTCKLCDCDVTGTNEQICDANSGMCLCKEGYAGDRCDLCKVEYYGYPNCQPCNCYEKGSLYSFCSTKSGKCSCLSNYDSRTCNKCKPGFFNDTINGCVSCGCDIHGSLGSACNSQGKCTCKENYDGDKCDRCRKNYFVYPFCERCECNMNGIKDTFSGCNQISTIEKLCDCKERVQGRKCDQCKSLYWKLNKYNPLGCQDCQCYNPGTLSGLGICHSTSGQCVCKNAISNRVCNTCKEGYWKMEEGNLFGCSSCECSSGGSEHPFCLRQSGKCSCKPKITGRTCDRPTKSHYFPTLYQLIYEMEDAITPQGTQARYDYNEKVFPNYSWRGYANYSDVQKELYLDTQIDQPSIYRPVINYVNSGNEPVIGQLTLLPISQANSQEMVSSIQIQLEPTNGQPKRYLTPIKVGMQSVFALKPGRWRMQLKMDKPILVDYLVLLPEEYWNVNAPIDYFELPCTLVQVQEPNRLCKQYAYPDYTKNSTILNTNQLASSPNYYEKQELVDKLPKSTGIKPIILTEIGQEYKFSPKSNGKHMLIVNYHHFDLVDDVTLQGKHELNKLDLKIKKLTDNAAAESSANKESIKSDAIKNRTLYEKFLRNFIEYNISNEEPVAADLSKCIYSFTCRQVIKTQDDDIAIFDLSKLEEYQLSIKPSDNSTNSAKLPAIIDLTLIPLDDWSLDYVRGEVLCSRNATGHCISQEFIDQENENRLRFVDRSEDGQTEAEKETVYKIDENNMIDLSQSNFLNSNQLTVIASGNVSEPKLYTFLVEYYQPTHASYDIQSNIILNGGTKREQNIPSKIPIKYCPNVSGCKTQIVTITNGTLFELNDQFDLAIAFPTDKSIYIKKINVIRNDNFMNSLLNAQPTLQPQIDFYKECAQDAFFINATLYNAHWNQTANSLIIPDDNQDAKEEIKKVSKFCRDTIFALAVRFNRGALSCNCDQRGSTSYDCNHFGGQCLCKPHVIGRTCNQCKMGYYGFPNCQQCNCPSTAYCEPKTGHCLCPPRVIGNQCDKCAPFTFGYHAIIGCQECNCHSSGVLNGNLQCDINTGSCECKKNIDGRRCNQCVSGFYSFPQCTLCSCDKRGANDKICDSNSGRCFCKSNTAGESCDQCKSDSFNLEESNQLGCSKCWCSGVSSRCRSSDLVYVKHTDMLNNFGSRIDLKVIQDRKNLTSLTINNDGWTISKLIFITEKSFNEYTLNFITQNNETALTDNEAATKLTLNEKSVNVILPESERKELNINQDLKQSVNVIYGYYLRLPSTYLGKRLSSYGGRLSYKIVNSVPDNYEGVFTGPDVIMVGNNVTIIHETLEQPVSTDEKYLVNLTLTEKSFKYLNGLLVTREKFLQVLLNVTAIYVKGAYFKYANQLTLSEVTIDIGSNDALLKTDNSNYAKAVEQCFCPKGYKGLSCDECSSGYWQISDTKGSKYCVPCKCNGHSQECDVSTGACFNCAHNTTGDHCEKCVVGYYGDATKGTSADCLICPCPMNKESNNFALSCKQNAIDSLSRSESYALSQLSSTQFTCECRKGYRGSVCQECDVGYFGQPFIENSTCQPCNCSGNADLSIPGACDTITGRCLMCLNNTYGDKCAICAPNYYGDAIEKKDCKQCSCSKCGTTKCNHLTGICECKPRVTGVLCTECEEDHWGFGSCTGCKACNCGVGSNSTQCNLITGDCFCKTGVGGALCDKCLPGFFNLTSEGCTDCNCTKKFSLGSVCDVAGKCRCLPGVVGDNCAGCPPRWTFIAGIGCEPCSNCVHGLLDFTDELKLMLDEVMSDIGDSSSSMLANKKLSRVNETVISLKNRLAEMFDRQLNNDSGIDNLNLLRILQRNGSDIESLAKKLIDLKQSLIDQARQMVNETNNCTIKIYHLHSAIYNTKQKLIKEIQWVKTLANTLIPAKIINEESIVQKAQIIMTQLKQINLTDNLQQSIEHLNASDELHERVSKFQKKWLDTQNEIEEIKKKIDKFNDLMIDYKGWTQEAVGNTLHLEQNYVGLKDTYKDILMTNKKLNDLNATIENLLQKAKEQNEKSKKVLDEELVDLNVDKQYDELLSKYDKMQMQRNDLNEEMEKLQKLVVNALTNVDNLNINATKIVNAFKDTKSYSLDPLYAANSYLKMKEDIELSDNSVIDSYETIRNAKDLLNIGNKTEKSKVDSYNLKTSAMNNQVKINNEIGVRLNETKNRLNDLNFKLNEHLNKQKNIQDHTTKLQNSKIKQDSEVAMSLSDNAMLSVERHKEKLNEKERSLLDQLELQTNEFDGKVKNGSSALKGILAFHKAIDTILPKLHEEKERAPAKLERINRTKTQLDQSLNLVKKNVKSARATANRIDLGLEIKPNTYVELRPPANLLKPGTYTKLSLYFRPFVANGLIAYLGNPKSIKSTAQGDQFQRPLLNDYLAIELREKRIALIMDVGNEPLIVFHDQQVELSKWHYVEVEIIGKHVQLKLRPVDQTEKTVFAHQQGTLTVFNLDRLNSKLYLGGIPKNIEIQDKIENVDFDGEVQWVTLGDTRLGIWNFVTGRNNNKGIYKKEAAFKNVNSDSNSIKFNGKAYVQLDGSPYGDTRRQTDLILQMKTLSNDGLIFLIGGTNMYLSVEVEASKLVVRIDLDSGSGEIRSKESVNDGKWHEIAVSRLDKNILVKLDGKEIEEIKTISGRDQYLETDGQIYFGGYPNGGHTFEKVTRTGFNGCLRDIQIGSKIVKTDKDDRNISPGVEFGCTDNVVRELSFEKAGFITMPLKNDINQISLKFRTKEQNGLLFFTSNRNLSQYLAIYLNRGILVFRSQPGELISSSTHTERQFNDNNWHYLTATRTSNIMRLDLDDKYVYQPERQQRTGKPISYDALELDDNVVYFGGVDDDRKDKLEPLDIPTSFIGCLGDVNLNEEVKNFAFSEWKRNVQLVSCLKESVENESEETAAPDQGPSPSIDEDLHPNIDPRKPLTTTTTTTTEEPEITGAKHRLVRGCKLPVKPNDPNLAESLAGLKFGGKKTSRTEIKLENAKIKEIEKDTKIEFEFQTNRGSGLLLLMVDNKFIDHTLVAIVENKLLCSFNLGSRNLVLTLDKEISSEDWHKVMITRQSKEVIIRLDGEEISGTIPGDKTSLNVNPVLYVGGLPAELIEQANVKMEENYGSFDGCINNVKLNDDYQTLDLTDSFDGVEGCSSNSQTTESGLFFKGKGYAQLENEFVFGDSVQLIVEVKPRAKNGVILYARSSNESLKDYFLLELVEGSLRVKVDNGGPKNKIEAKVDLPNDESCDGNWHQITLIKVANLLIVSSGDYSSGPQIISQTEDSDFTTQTNILYIGGYPPELKTSKKYLENATNYAGCIRSVKLQTKGANAREETFDLTKVLKNGDIELDNCPTT